MVGSRRTIENRWRKMVKILLVCLFSMVLPLGTFIDLVGAQEYPFPSKPIKLFNPGTPGDSTDLPFRALGKAVEKILGQPIVNVSVPGAGGARALSMLLKEKPDGYTLGLMTTGSLITARVEKFKYSMVNDFTPVLKVQTHPLPFAVRKDAPWKTWQELMKYAREHKEIVTVGVFGATSAGWMALVQIDKIEKIKFVYVPFPGGGEAMSALLGGHITANTLTSGTLYAKSGELKVLLFFSDKRLNSFPEIPTAKELYGWEGVGITGGFTGIIAPKGLPEPILAKLQDAYKRALEDPEFLRVIEKFDLIVSYKNPNDFLEEIRRTDEGIGKILAEESK